MNILSFGELLFDVYADKACLGGAPLNFAAHIVRHGDSAQLLSAVGNDPLGELAREQTAALGVGTDCLAVQPDRPTGVCRVTLSADSVPSYHLEENTAWDAIPADGVCGAFDVLYVGTLSLRSESNRRALSSLCARHQFTDVFADVNVREPFCSEDALRTVLEKATVLKVSSEELPSVCAYLGVTPCADAEKTMRAVAAQAPRLRAWILTCGADGACAWERETDRVIFAKAVPTEAVSTVGAGDSFSAAFLSKYLRGVPLDACLRHAAAVAALVVSHTEAVPAYDPACLTV